LHPSLLPCAFQFRHKAIDLPLPFWFFQRGRRASDRGPSQTKVDKVGHLGPKRAGLGPARRKGTHMSAAGRLRHRMSVALHMVVAFIITILLGQLWLFSVALEAVEDGAVSSTIAVAALCSLLACIAIWALIQLFLRAEDRQ